MPKPARGTKRVCASCDARFYDLGRSPIVCPACGAVYQVAAPTRRDAAAPPTAKPKPEVQTEEEDKPATGDAEVISLDEAEEAEEAAVADEEIVDIGEDDEDIPDSDDQDAFLEDDEGEDTHVTGIVKKEREDET